MREITSILKVFFLVLTLLFHALLSLALKAVFAFNFRFRLLYTARVNRLIAGILAFLLGVRVRRNSRAVKYKAPVLYAGNHLSYLDALAVAVHYPVVFVTSADMGERKSEGWICGNAGSVFVERRREKLSFDRIKGDIEGMKKIMENKGSLCIFPEATSAGGEKDLKFFSSLFASVEYTAATVAPFALRYTSINKEPLTDQNKDIVYFYRGERFIPHIKRLLRNGHITVDVSFPPAFSAINMGRKEIARECKKLIARELSGGPDVSRGG